jgi:hypothetical protein
MSRLAGFPRFPLTLLALLMVGLWLLAVPASTQGTCPALNVFITQPGDGNVIYNSVVIKVSMDPAPQDTEWVAVYLELPGVS